MKLRFVVIVVSILALAACGTTPSSDPKAGEHDHGGPDAFNIALVTSNVIADVTVDPARVGDVMVHMEFAPPGGRLQQISTVSGTLTSSDPSLPVIDLQFDESGTNHFHSDITVPAVGEWILEFEATLADGASARYSTPIDFTS